jgi:hypothetical protein
VGHGAWLKGTNDLPGGVVQPVAASGAWTADDTYEVRLCFYEGELCSVLRFRCGDRDVWLEVEPNVAWGVPTVSTIMGRAID